MSLHIVVVKTSVFDKVEESFEFFNYYPSHWAYFIIEFRNTDNHIKSQNHA